MLTLPLCHPLFSLSPSLSHGHLDFDFQAKVKCLQVPPSEMNEKLKAKRQKLLQACQEKLLHDESKPLAILEELEQWCIRKEEAFLKLYREKYKVLLLYDS